MIISLDRLIYQIMTVLKFHFSLGCHQTPCLLSLQVKKWFVTCYHVLTYQKLVATTA